MVATDTQVGGLYVVVGVMESTNSMCTCFHVVMVGRNSANSTTPAPLHPPVPVERRGGGGGGGGAVK